MPESHSCNAAGTDVFDRLPIRGPKGSTPKMFLTVSHGRPNCAAPRVASAAGRGLSWPGRNGCPAPTARARTLASASGCLASQCAAGRMSPCRDRILQPGGSRPESAICPGRALALSCLWDQRRIGTGMRSLGRYGVIGAVLIVFFLANTDSVEINFLVTEAEAPLIVILLVTALLGAVLGWFVRFLRRRN